MNNKMYIPPIPNQLLGSSLVLEVATENGFTLRNVSNVRVEREESITDFTSSSQHDYTKITVWFDYTNSQPATEFEVGMKVRYDGEIFEIVKSKIYGCDTPHHCRFEARKIGVASD